MIEAAVTRYHQNVFQVIQSYYRLTKPRIIPLLLITTADSMWIAAKGRVDPLLLLVTLLGGTLAAAAAQTMNCIYDQDIALILGILFIKKAWALLQNPADKLVARSLFVYSIFYMMLLCTGMVINSLPITHQLTSALIANLHLLI